MPFLDHSAQVTLVVLPFALLFTAAIVIFTLWMPFKAKLKAIDVLKVYAERGQEPPASVVDAVNQIGRPPPPPAPRVQSRAEHLTHVAASVVLSIGAGGVAWWRAHQPVPGGLMVWALIVAIFFAAAAAARLVAAISTRDGR